MCNSTDLFMVAEHCKPELWKLAAKLQICKQLASLQRVSSLALSTWPKLLPTICKMARFTVASQSERNAQLVLNTWDEVEGEGWCTNWGRFLTENHHVSRPSTVLLVFNLSTLTFYKIQTHNIHSVYNKVILHIVLHSKRSRDSTVIIVTRLRGSIPGRGEDFSFRHRLQIGCGSHPASCPVGIGTISPEVKRPVCEADHSHLSTIEAKNAWSYISIPHMSTWHGS
jgi:hypothetical protein